MIVQCCICGNRRNSTTHEWYTPSRDERIIHHKNVSHGYCPDCFIILMKDEGMTNTEIKDILLSYYNKLSQKGW